MPCRLPNPPLDKCNLHVTKASELLSRIFNMLHEILHLWIINYCLFPQSNLLVFMNLTCNVQLSNNFSFDSGMTCMHGFHGFKVCMLQNFFQDTWIECIYIYIYVYVCGCVLSCSFEPLWYYFFHKAPHDCKSCKWSRIFKLWCNKTGWSSVPGITLSRAKITGCKGFFILRIQKQ